MTDPQEVALPPLPTRLMRNLNDEMEDVTPMTFTADELRTYARAAITADRAHREKEREEAAMYGWIEAQAFQKTAYDIFGNGGHWTVGVHSDDSNKSFAEAVRAAMSRTAGER